jgi:hypothetical protein
MPFLTKLFGLPKAAPEAKPMIVPKSAARLADEQNILAARRAILENLARLEAAPSARDQARSLVDQDLERAAAAVRRLLLHEGSR